LQFSRHDQPVLAQYGDLLGQYPHQRRVRVADVEGEGGDAEAGGGGGPLAGDVVGLDACAVPGQDFVEDAQRRNVEQGVDVPDQRMVVQVEDVS
jgi:hypothetical protein